MAKRTGEPTKPIPTQSVFDIAAPDRIPLPALLSVVKDWFETNHIERMRDAGYSDARRAYNAVFANLPANGSRLTDLARRADMTKQAMAELVDELIERRYLRRVPDPSDGRAKIILWAARGRSAHQATLGIFAHLETELSLLVGTDTTKALRRTAGVAAAALAGGSRQ